LDDVASNVRPALPDIARHFMKSVPFNSTGKGLNSALDDVASNARHFMHRVPFNSTGQV
jgi:hypothetical protein